jgi:hypothetical protein
LLAALLCLLLFHDSYGAHLWGGEIAYRRDPDASSPYAYAFALRLYNFIPGVEVSPTAKLDFGVAGATQTAPLTRRERVRAQTGQVMEVLVYTFRYTYPGPGTYTVSFNPYNRPTGTANIGQTTDMAFHLQTSFIISPTAGANNGPQLLNPPIFQVVAGQKVCMGPAAYDPEGDSLSYRLIVPLAKANTDVKGYQFPNQVTPAGVSENGGKPTFAIDALTGEICWDAPGLRKRGGGVMTEAGDRAEYTIAFAVEEWRNGVKLSSTVRDFNVAVVLLEKLIPEVQAPNAAAAGFNANRQVRVEPGQRLTFSVLSRSPLPGASDSLVLVSETGRPYGNASVTAIDSAGFTKVTYAWTPTEANRRRHPYVLVFRGSSSEAWREDGLFNDLTFSVYVGSDIPKGRVTTTEVALNDRNIRLFPNPAQNIVRLAEVPGTGAVYFRLTDASGRQVYASANLRETNLEMDLTTVPNGIYVYTITADLGVVGKGRLLKR